MNYHLLRVFDGTTDGRPEESATNIRLNVTASYLGQGRVVARNYSGMITGSAPTT